MNLWIIAWQGAWSLNREMGVSLLEGVGDRGHEVVEMRDVVFLPLHPPRTPSSGLRGIHTTASASRRYSFLSPSC
jgi:hypothetical protein